MRKSMRWTVLSLILLLCLFVMPVLANAASSITLPEGLLTIEEEAFLGATSLENVYVPEGTTSIGARAFANSSLQYIELPASVESIADDAFEGCDELEVYAPEGSYAAEWWKERNPYSPASDFGYFIQNDECIIRSYRGEGGHVAIPKRIERCPVVALDYYAFYRCSSLTSISIPDGVTSIGYSAFDGCTSLTEILLPDSITFIEDCAFMDCSSLIEIVLPNSVTSIEDRTFESCTGLTSISIPEGVTSIGHLAFANCTSLTEISLPDSVISIGDQAFSECTSLTNILISDNVTHIGTHVFYDCSSLTSISVPNSVEYIGEYAFMNCSSLTSISLQDDVEYIGEYAFSGCTSLTEISIPESVTFFGDGAFYDCVNLSSISFLASVTYINDSAFADCSKLTSISISDSITHIGENAFRDCSSLTEIALPDSVTHIGEGAFSDCTSLAEILIPDSVISIGTRAFNGCASLTSISIPNSVTYVGTSAFEDCSSLTSISVPATMDDETFYPFAGCTSVVSVALNEGTTTIDGTVFDWTYLSSQIVNISIPNSVINIGDNAFEDYGNLTSIVLPDGLISIGKSVFKGCKNLDSILLPDSVASIGDEAFYECRNLTEISIPDGVTHIGDNTFFKCSSLTSVSLPDSLAAIGDGVFEYCSSLTSVSIPDGVTSVGNSAFANCSGLTNVSIPDGVTSIGDSAFAQCSDLTSISIPDSVTYIGSDAFWLCERLNHLFIPDGVTFIGDGAFSACHSLTRISIPNSVTSIGDDIFYSCTSLISISLPNSITCIGNYAFYNCTSLTSISLPDSVTSIESNAFNNCTSLTSIFIPSSVTNIGYYVFYRCNLKTIYGESGSYAETYAEENNIPFSTDPFPDTPAEETVHLSGCVTLSNGTPLENVVVYISADNIKDEFAGCAYTAADGNWSCNVAAGKQYTLYYYHSDYEMAANEVPFFAYKDTVLETVIATVAEGNGSADVSFTMQLAGADIPVEGVVTGDIVTFQISAENAQKVRLIADGEAYDEYELTEGSTVIERSFSRSGVRNIAFQAYDGTAWGKISESQMLVITALGKLASPAIHAVDTQYVNESFTVTWDEVPNADRYTVYLYHHDLLWPSLGDISVSTTQETGLEIPGKFLYTSGGYLIEVIASGYNYSQSASSVEFLVEATRDGARIVYPSNGAVYNVGDTMHVSTTADSRVTSIKLQLNEEDVMISPDENGVFYPVASIVGMNTFTPYYSYDDNTYTAGTSVTVQVKAPSIRTLLQGPNKHYAVGYTNTSFEFSGLLADGRYTLSVSLNGADSMAVAVEKDGSFTITAGPLENSGKYVYTFVPAYGNTDGEGIEFPIYEVEKSNEKLLYAEELLYLYTLPDRADKSLLPCGSAITLLGTYGDSHLYVSCGSAYGFITAESLLSETSPDSELELTISCTETEPYTAVNAVRAYTIENEGFTSVSAVVKMPDHTENTLFGTKNGDVFTIEIPVSSAGVFECVFSAVTESTKKEIYAAQPIRFLGVDTSYSHTGKEFWSNHKKILNSYTIPDFEEFQYTSQIDVTQNRMVCLGLCNDGLILAVVTPNNSATPANYAILSEHDLTYQKNTTVYRALAIVNPLQASSYEEDVCVKNTENIYALFNQIEDIDIISVLGKEIDQVNYHLDDVKKQADYNDITYIYWAGHGSNGSWSILPALGGSGTSTIYMNYFHYWLVDALLPCYQLSESTVWEGKINIIIDTCHAGSFIDELTDSSLYDTSTLSSIAVLMSTKADEVGIYDYNRLVTDWGKGSRFTQELKKYICKNKSSVLADITNNVRVSGRVKVEDQTQTITPTVNYWGDPERVFFAEDPDAVR